MSDRYAQIGDKPQRRGQRYNGGMQSASENSNTDRDEPSKFQRLDREAVTAQSPEATERELPRKFRRVDGAKLQTKDTGSFAPHIGDRISIRRRELNLSQKELAQLYGVSRELISQFETGRSEINAGDLPRLAKILLAPISYFYGGIEYPLPDEIRPVASAPMPDEDELLAYYRTLRSGLKEIILKQAKALFEMEQG